MHHNEPFPIFCGERERERNRESGTSGTARRYCTVKLRTSHLGHLAHLLRWGTLLSMSSKKFQHQTGFTSTGRRCGARICCPKCPPDASSHLLTSREPLEGSSSHRSFPRPRGANTPHQNSVSLTAEPAGPGFPAPLSRPQRRARHGKLMICMPV